MALVDQTKTWLAQYNLLPARRTAERTIFLYVSMLANLLLGFTITKLNSAWLTVDEFGIYSFVINTVLFTRVFLSFGIFESGARILATSPGKDTEKNILGGLVTITLILGIILSSSIYVFSFFFDNIFKIKISHLLIVIWPLVILIPYQLMISPVFRGMSRILRLGVYTMLPRILYLASIVILFFTGLYNLVNTINYYFITISIIAVVAVTSLKPSFKGLREGIKKLLNEYKTYGKYIYIANIFTSLVQYADKIILALFVSGEKLGYYALAFALTFPLAHFPMALSNVSFKKYASQERLNSKHVQATIAFGIISLIVLIALRHFIIIDLFGEQFRPSITPFIILAIAFVVNGISIPYTMFFKAQKKGKQVRNITTTAQTLNIVLDIILIPFFGIIGAAIAALISFSTDLSLYIIYHIRLFGKK